MSKTYTVVMIDANNTKHDLITVPAAEVNDAFDSLLCSNMNLSRAIRFDERETLY